MVFQRKIQLIKTFLVLFFLQNSQQALIYKQSDKVFLQLQEKQLLPAGNTNYYYEIDFPVGQFKQTPNILYSTTNYDAKAQNCSNSFYSITTASVTSTKLQYKITTIDCQVNYLFFYILASDDPSIQVTNETIVINKPSQVITFNGIKKIKQFSPFYAGFERNSSSQIQISQEIRQVDDTNYSITLNTVNITQIIFNYLVIYEDNDTSLLSQLYSYQQVIDPRKNDCKPYQQTIVKWIETTKLVDNSLILYGLKDFNIQSNTAFSVMMLQNSAVKDKQVDLGYKGWANRVVKDVNGIQVQFMLKNCENNEYMYINPQTKETICTVDCQGVDHHYYNNPTLQTLYSTSIKVCTACSQNCFGCRDGEPDKCLDCYKGKYFNPNHQICEDNKPAGTYCNLVNVSEQNYYNCGNCDESCKECTGGQSNECISCKSKQNQPQPYFFLGQCYPSQPARTYCKIII